MSVSTRRPQSPSVPAAQFGKLREVKLRDLAIRFALGATISIVAGVLSKTIDPRFGGTFLAFPAILPASLTLIQEKEGTRRAGRNAIGAVLGSVGMIAFAMICEATFGHIEAYTVLVLATAGWLVCSVLLYVVLAKLRPDDCDRTKD